MVINNGISVIMNERFSRIVDKYDSKVLDRLFTDDELRYCLKSVNSLQHLSARFAAKCAFYQALKWSGARNYKLLQVSKDNYGAPFFEFYGILKERYSDVGTIHLTLSHIKDYSLANVIIEK